LSYSNLLCSGTEVQHNPGRTDNGTGSPCPRKSRHADMGFPCSHPH